MRQKSAQARAADRAYRKTHATECNAYNRRWRAANPQKAKASRKRSYDKHADKRRKESRTYYAEHIAGKPRKIRPAPPEEKRICAVCEQAFTCGLKEWAHSFRKRRTCGRKCGTILRARERTYLQEKPCQECGTVFKPRNADDKFCSKPCYWKNKKGREATHIPPQIQRVLVICPWCLIMHPQRPKEVERGRIFCSKKCYRLFQARFRLGKHIPYTENNAFYLSKAWGKLRRAIKKRDSYTCQACQRVFSPNSRGLAVHHIRPRGLCLDAGPTLHPIADALTNLVALCLSCHQRTHLGQIPQFLDEAA